MKEEQRLTLQDAMWSRIRELQKKANANHAQVERWITRELIQLSCEIPTDANDYGSMAATLERLSTHHLRMASQFADSHDNESLC